MTNFAITPCGDNHVITPVNKAGKNLAKHCKNHGDNLIYPTLASALEAAQHMDIAIANRNGDPWVIFKN